jgi:hypothetical protein
MHLTIALKAIETFKKNYMQKSNNHIGLSLNKFLTLFIILLF